MEFEHTLSAFLTGTEVKKMILATIKYRRYKQFIKEILVILEKVAVAGPVIPDNERPSIPMHENCDPDWAYSSTSGKCYFLEFYEKSWGAANSNCVGIGAELAAINSPDIQRDLFKLSQLDGTAIGKTLLNLIMIHRKISIRTKFSENLILMNHWF